MYKFITTLCALIIALSMGCLVYDPPTRPNPDGSYTVPTYYYTPDSSDYVCYDEPYIWSPDWCDYYSDNTICCVWYVDGWYEEWCQWGDDWCWDYVGAW